MKFPYVSRGSMIYIPDEEDHATVASYKGFAVVPRPPDDPNILIFDIILDPIRLFRRAKIVKITTNIQKRSEG